MDSEELLAQLADIHLPEPVNFWPPAPGWWILATLLLIMIAWIISKGFIISNRRKIKAQALVELDRCYSSYVSELENESGSDANRSKLSYANEANSVLKRVALVHFPGAAVAGLGGPEWVRFIRENGESTLLTTEISDALSHGRFQTKLEINVDEMNDFATQWIASLYDAQGQKQAVRSTPQTAGIEETAH
ncbi:MAG: hypothetical protein ACJA2Q_000054 [Pseudohongiellaceae bacterium]|jgi:hypothetical protein